MTTLTVADLTQTTLAGTGVFDVLMRANRAHLENEYTLNRIKGAEYATVYLGSLEAVMRASLEFLLQRDKNDLERQLLAQQIILAGVEVQKAQAELAIIQASLPKIAVEIAQIQAQTRLVDQQKTNLVDELQTAVLQRTKLTQETANLVTQSLHIVSQTSLIDQQRSNEGLRAANIPKEGLVLDGQKCKLDAEFNLIKSDILKTDQEIALLAQKAATEKAQVSDAGVSESSVIGRQKALYAAQTAGFKRDAEQKAAKIMIDTWNVRKTASPDDAGISASNGLIDSNIGVSVSKLLSGIA